MLKKIFVAGHNGMVGSAICRKLTILSDVEIITRTHKELDLCDQNAVQDFIRSEKPDVVVLAAAKVGGIHANNTYPAEFIYQNLQIQNNVIHASHLNDIQQLLFLGSSCIYPINIPQPMREDALLTGTLEPSNEPYAISKIAGLKMCESYNRQYGRDYRAVMPTNLYGPGDNYHPENSHVIPALIRRIHEAKEQNLEQVVIWGSGTPMREFLYVDDMAEASCYILSLDKEVIKRHTDQGQSHINIGTGKEISIRELAETIKSIIGFDGHLSFDQSKLDGSPRKLVDVQRLKKLGYEAPTDLISGIELTYSDFLNNKSELRM